MEEKSQAEKENLIDFQANLRIFCSNLKFMSGLFCNSYFRQFLQTQISNSNQNNNILPNNYEFGTDAYNTLPNYSHLLKKKRSTSVNRSDSASSSEFKEKLGNIFDCLWDNSFK